MEKRRKVEINCEIKMLGDVRIRGNGQGIYIGMQRQRKEIW
jgi:hypothetical protein